MKWYELYKWQDIVLTIVLFVSFFGLFSRLPNLHNSDYITRIIALLDPVLGTLVNGLIVYLLLLVVNTIYKRIKKI